MTKWPIFSLPIRVFFPLASLIAILVPMYTVTALVNEYPFTNSLFQLFEWHAFEMFFGFFYTVIMGFILTAGAKWTGKDATNGLELILLTGFWVIDQITIFTSSSFLVLIISSTALSLYFIFLVAKMLWAYQKKWLFLIIISLLSTSKLVFIYYATHRGFHFKYELYDFIAILFSFNSIIIAGRVIPNFTRNFLKLDYQLTTPPVLNLTALVATALLLVTPFISLRAPMVCAILYIFAGISNLVRLYFWEFRLSVKKPIIGMLHIGFLILCLSFITKGLSFYYIELEFTKATLHFMLAGGVSILVLNIMNRAILGHTGRKIESNNLFLIMNAALVIGLFVRVIVPIFYPDSFHASLHNSMGFWSLAFLLFFFRCMPIIFIPRK